MKEVGGGDWRRWGRVVVLVGDGGVRRGVVGVGVWKEVLVAAGRR